MTLAILMERWALLGKAMHFNHTHPNNACPKYNKQSAQELVALKGMCEDNPRSVSFIRLLKLNPSREIRINKPADIRIWNTERGFNIRIPHI